METNEFIEDYRTYTPTEGEEYMSTNMLMHFEKKLNAWKDQLLEEIEMTVEHLQNDSNVAADPNDRASQEEDFALELRTRDRERKLINKIDKSILDIKNGNYGYCTISGEEIGLERMDARPTATLTVEMKRQQELREKQGLS